jgi:hypothetical protein
MPEMLVYCGRRYTVAASAHKTCDSIYYAFGREMEQAVFLEDLRCDGSGHGACEAKCLLFFKLAWLKPVQPARDWRLEPVSATPQPGRDAQWLRGTTVRTTEGGQPFYRCQATEHLRATRAFKPNTLRMFVADWRSGNASLSNLMRAIVLQSVYKLRFMPFGWRVWISLYKLLHGYFYQGPDPHAVGTIPLGQPTPEVRLNLQVGENVRVRLLPVIEATINVRLRNRGLAFNPEMSPFCGGTFRVERAIKRIVDERDGHLLDLKGPCIMLEGAQCQARYHPAAVLCKRRIPQYFREAWLERVQGSVAGDNSAHPSRE